MRKIAYSNKVAMAAICGLFATNISNAEEAAFANTIRPITNPVYFDSALPQTQIHPIFLYQNMPSSISTQLGDVPLGGNFQLYAVQAELALNERLSLVAAKDGYIVFNPDNTLVNASGFANLAAGLKYAFIYDPAEELVVSGQAILELPTGNTDVWQGGKYYSITPSVGVLKSWDDFQLSTETGFIISTNSNGSSSFFTSAHASYSFFDMFHPLVEVNYLQVINPGNGASRFSPQAGGAVPAIVNFEGGDLVNFGASNSNVYSAIVTGAIGFRITPMESIELGAAFEIPLTQTSHNLMQNRITLDAVWKF
ncbi:transporter [Cerasicoccus fimbriatus]|uniref:transporter n=1 Tax=Cerasicoccus fimbriatus TaxID=3014554 RepID=UPI0022B4F0C7|nr:transporter [Cerasicoccus sp. TK19100]